MAKPNVYLSPSNQGKNLYATGNTNEMHQCDKIAKAAKKALVRCGINTMVGKSGDTMENRCKESNAFNADVHLPIHTNAFNGKTTGGTQVYVSKLDAVRVKAGNALLKAVGKISPGDDYVLKTNTSWYEINVPKAMTLYLEVEFHDTKKGAEWIINNIDAIGEAIAKGMCDYFGIKYVAPETNDTKPSDASTSEPTKNESEDGLYRIQVGAYKSKTGANTLLKKVKDAGFDACLIQVDGLWKVQLGAFKSKTNADGLLAKVKTAGFDAFITTNGQTKVEKPVVKKEIKVGSTVKLKKGAKTFNGGNLASFVYERNHKVKEINVDRVVITYNGIIVAAVRKSDLTVVD